MRLLRDYQHHRKFLPPWIESLSHEINSCSTTDITAGTSALKYYAISTQCLDAFNTTRPIFPFLNFFSFHFLPVKEE